MCSVLWSRLDKPRRARWTMPPSPPSSRNKPLLRRVSSPERCCARGCFIADPQSPPAVGAIETGLGPKRIVSAMSAGSLIGAALGGLAVGFAPVGLVKVVLGVVLIAAAAKVAISQHVS
jgi:hypothetical protein